SIFPLSSRLKFLCEGMKADISPELASHFIPYMQIHEFESLLFSDISIFKDNFEDKAMEFSILEDAVREFENPEEINSRPTLAPSKRLIEAIPGYQKVNDGAYIADEIGLKKILDKCPLFSQWFLTLQSL
ncbi:MAG: DUF4276 family protein, partial [Muribaculaceae bacterium]|nr:DUF4276 family protein [Muribaculaceae bacterium]